MERGGPGPKFCVACSGRLDHEIHESTPKMHESGRDGHEHGERVGDMPAGLPAAPLLSARPARGETFS